MPSLVRPIEAATFDHAGEAIVLNPNAILSADDPIVRARPHLFKPVEPLREIEPTAEKPKAAGTVRTRRTTGTVRRAKA